MFFTAPDGASLHYEDEGEGLPLLCLPGLTRNTEDFAYLAPHLPPCRLIRMDYRGRGRSAFTGPKTYNVPQEGADAIALLDHLGLPKAAILGTSRGGLVALHERAGIALRTGPALLRLWDDVVDSTLDFSGLRLRNARLSA